MKRIKRYQNIFRGVRIPWVMLAVLLILNIIESHVFLEQTTLTADIIDASQKAINANQLVRFIVVLLVNSALSISINYINGWTDQKLSYGVRNKLWNKLGQTEISEAEENMIAVDIIQRYADYFQKVISDYYKDKIQVVIQ